MAEQVAIEIDRVVRVYRRAQYEVRALDGVSITVPAGSFVALMGPSGSGKTTLLNLVAGLDRATSGRITVGGNEITAMTERELGRWRASHVGLIFQFYNLLPVLTAFENVELPLLLTNLPKAARGEHVEAALRLVGLIDRRDHYPRQLSGGQEQRVAIARALVTDPTIIIADEPTGDLDARSAEEILALFALLSEKLSKTVLMVTHDPRAEKHVELVYRLDKGVLMSVERAANFRSAAAKTVRAGSE